MTQTPLRLSSTPEEPRDASQDRLIFFLDDEEMLAVRPKMAVLLEVATVLADDTDQMAQAAAFGELLDRVLSEASAAHIRARLQDPDDDLDLDSPAIERMFQYLVGTWYGRPTGRQGGSRSSASRTGKRSTVRRRSTA